MSKIEVLSPDHFDDLVDIIANAYPGMRLISREDREQRKQRMLKLHLEEPTAQFYGLFRQERLVGVMLLHDFRMNLLQTQIAAGGVGEIAVALDHKKEHVAKEMVEFFIRHYRERGVPLALLYPFRPDFYRKMGFGYGTKMSQYRVKPAALPRGPSRAHIRFLDEGDRQALLDCYTRFAHSTHGMIDKSASELDRIMQRPQYQIVGYEADGQVRGYCVFTFEHGESWLANDIGVRELVYETREALAELLTFLHTQADQIRHVIFNTQEEFFHYLPLDPRDDSGRMIPSVYHQSNTQGVGLMYRVIDTPAIFRSLEDRDFGGQTCRLKLTIEDSFLPENTGSILLSFDRGQVTLAGEGEGNGEVRIDVAAFSSLIMGAVSFRWLHRYGLADITDPGLVDVIDGIFAVADKPMCTTDF